jgi:hypothetical protein
MPVIAIVQMQVYAIHTYAIDAPDSITPRINPK